MVVVVVVVVVVDRLPRRRCRRRRVGARRLRRCCLRLRHRRHVGRRLGIHPLGSVPLLLLPGGACRPFCLYDLGVIVSDSSFSAVVPVVTALHLSLFLFFMAIRFSNCPSSRGLRYLREE